MIRIAIKSVKRFFVSKIDIRKQVKPIGFVRTGRNMIMYRRGRYTCGVGKTDANYFLRNYLYLFG